MREDLYVSGASIAVVSKIDYPLGYEMIAIQRDDRPDVPYRNQWEFPGGTMDPGETPVQCALRELYEETGVQLSEDTVVWEAFYPRLQKLADGTQPYTAFFVARAQRSQLPELVKGDEGKACRWLRGSAFYGRIALEDGVYCQAICDHIDRFQDFMLDVNGHQFGKRPRLLSY